MMQERNYRTGHFFLGIVVLTWGANFGIVKSAYDTIPPLLFGALRFTVMGILLLAVTFWREKEILIRKEDLGKVIMVGALGLGLYQVLWSLGLNLTSPSNSALILSTQPLLGTLYIDLVKKEPVGKQQYWGMLLALVGVVLVILKPTAKLHFSLETLPGDLLTLMAGFCSAIFFSVLSKPLLKTYSPLRLMSYCMIIGSLALWIASPFSAQPVVWGQVWEKTWWSMGYAVLFSGMLGHVFWYEGLGRIGVTKSMAYLYFIPIWAVLFNTLMMGETIFLQQILGGILILLGVHHALKN
ncbi:MAG: DMT family transporter [Thermodesulfobacteriota bacterium]|jgi:drug/metabolite transporter (DMT)-like permease